MKPFQLQLENNFEYNLKLVVAQLNTRSECIVRIPCGFVRILDDFYIGIYECSNAFAFADIRKISQMPV